MPEFHPLLRGSKLEEFEFYSVTFAVIYAVGKWTFNAHHQQRLRLRLRWLTRTLRPLVTASLDGRSGRLLVKRHLDSVVASSAFAAIGEHPVQRQECSEYQSKHFILKARADTDTSDCTVALGTPCEVQLRTLLQHAHSELTHDNIYKRESETVVSKRVERTVATSMALIETVDEFFLATLNEIEQANELERKAAANLCQLYAHHVGHPAQIDKTTTIVLHAFRDQFGPEFQGKVEALLVSKPFTPESISRRWNTQYIFRHPPSIRRSLRCHSA